MEIQEVQIVHMLTLHLHCTNGHQLANFLVAMPDVSWIGSRRPLHAKLPLFLLPSTLEQFSLVLFFAARAVPLLVLCQLLFALAIDRSELVVHGFARRQHSMLRAVDFLCSQKVSFAP